MFYLNKIVWFFVNPVVLPLVAGVTGLLVFAFARGRARRVAAGLVAAAFALLWAVLTPAFVCALGLPLERRYLALQRPEALPSADAIVLLGGGIGKRERMEYPDMADAADRIWHVARLYRAGKAPRVVVSGRNDLAAAVPLLTDLGVPREAILVDDESRNTYENSRFTEKLLAEAGVASPKVLLVTSAWHMPRALGNFSRTALEVTPAPADFKAHNIWHGCRWYGLLLPDPEGIAFASVFAKEWIGRFARK